MSDPTHRDRQAVELLIAQHGITVPPDEVEMFVAGYARKRAAVASLYALEGVRYEEPAVVFAPVPGM